MEERNLEFIFKKSLGVVSTFTDTSFYNEIVRKFKTPVQVEDVNIENAPTLPDWNDADEKSLFNLDSDDFASIDFTELHTVSSTYTKNGTKTPGIYLDSSETVALFVRLKLDKMEGFDASAIVYTKYPIDSSNTSLMDSAYQFDYNSQINVNSSISVFKPYNYTLEYSNDNSTFYQVTNDIGNWSFDTNSGTIIFEDDPKTFNSIIDLDAGNNLYFTFVKYVGQQGLQNLIYYNKNGHSGIGTKDPQNELDISGSVIISNNLEIVNDLYSGDILYVDSSNKRVGINTVDPSYELHVNGSVNISEKLTIANSVFGVGMCPIGTIIIWTNTIDPTGYGEWLLCDGRVVSSTEYQDLSNVLGSTGGDISLPDLRNRYTKGGPLTNEADISFGGTGYTTDISLTDIPSHTHTFDQHTHNITATSHHHETLSHQHETRINDSHRHQTNQHRHNMTEDNPHSHELAHSHSLNTSNHAHDSNHNHAGATENANSDETHDHGGIEIISGFSWNTHKRGNGTSGFKSDQTTATVAAATNAQTTSATHYNSNPVTSNQNTASTLDINSSVITQSADNTSGGNTISNNTNINETMQSVATLTSVSTLGIASTEESVLAATTKDYIDVDLSAATVTHSLLTDRSEPDTFRFSANPECIQIFYYIRAL